MKQVLLLAIHLRVWTLARYEEEIWLMVIKGSFTINRADLQFKAAAIRQLKVVIIKVKNSRESFAKRPRGTRDTSMAWGV